MHCYSSAANLGVGEGVQIFFLDQFGDDPSYIRQLNSSLKFLINMHLMDIASQKIRCRINIFQSQKNLQRRSSTAPNLDEFGLL